MVGEKRMLLTGIETLTTQLEEELPISVWLDVLKRRDTLVDCLMKLNWKEIDRRNG